MRKRMSRRNDTEHNVVWNKTIDCNAKVEKLKYKTTYTTAGINDIWKKRVLFESDM